MHRFRAHSRWRGHDPDRKRDYRTDVEQNAEIVQNLQMQTLALALIVVYAVFFALIHAIVVRRRP